VKSGVGSALDVGDTYGKGHIDITTTANYHHNTSTITIQSHTAFCSVQLARHVRGRIGLHIVLGYCGAGGYSDKGVATLQHIKVAANIDGEKLGKNGLLEGIIGGIRGVGGTGGVYYN